MRAIGGKSHELALVKARRVDHDVVQMLAAHPAMVHHHDVARFETAQAVSLNAVFHSRPEIGEEDRQAAAVLRNHPPLYVEQTTAIVAHFVDHHVVGGFGEHIRHLVGIGDDGIAHDFNGDGMGFGHEWTSGAMVMVRCPAAVTEAPSPGWMSVVALGSSMIAGPSIVMPAGKDGRQRILVFSGRSGSSKITSRVDSSMGPSACQGSFSQRSAKLSSRAAVTTRRRLTISMDSSGADWL